MTEPLAQAVSPSSGSACFERSSEGQSASLGAVEPDRAAQITDLLTRTNRSLRRQANTELHPLGVTPAQFRALRFLGRSEERLRVSELATLLGVVPRSATSVVDELESARTVRREADPADRRATLVVLTDHGRDVLQRWADVRRAGMAHLLDRLSGDDQAELVRLLTALADPDEPGAG